jgi:hypothetical protein
MSVSGPAPSAGCQLPDKVALPAATARVGSGSGWVLGGTLALRLPALVGSYTACGPVGCANWWMHGFRVDRLVLDGVSGSGVRPDASRLPVKRERAATGGVTMSA